MSFTRRRKNMRRIRTRKSKMNSSRCACLMAILYEEWTVAVNIAEAYANLRPGSPHLSPPHPALSQIAIANSLLQDSASSPSRVRRLVDYFVDWRQRRQRRRRRRRRVVLVGVRLSTN